MAHLPLARRVACIGSASVAILALAAGTAWAQPPITGTEVTTFSESFTEPTLCQDELYTTTADIRMVVHFTFFEDTGALHLHESIQGKVVAVPLDGTGPRYTGSFTVGDSENIRAVRNGDELVEVDTDRDRAVLHGSDGSKAFSLFHAHFTINANGETTVQLETDKLVCS